MKSKANTYCAEGEICILAGGLSARMGRDKSRMRLQGKTLLRHAQNIARASGWPVRVIRRDSVPRCGPLGAVYTALQTSSAPLSLFLACDMPFISAGYIQSLVAALRDGDEAVFTEADGRAGFPFILRSSTLATVKKQIFQRQFSIEQLSRACDARFVSVPPDQSWMFLNINTLQDWRLARKIAANAPLSSQKHPASVDATYH